MTKRAWMAFAALTLSYPFAFVHAEPSGPAGVVPAPASASAPASSQPTSQPASQPAAQTETAWPPGLWMEAAYALGAKPALDFTGVRFWGYVEPGFMGRLTGGQNPLPGRVYDGRRINELRLNQLVLVAERPYDASKEFDIGFRIDGLYGGDAMITHAAGLFPNAGHDHTDNWVDLLQGYGQVWLKTGKQSGLETTIGKWATTMGYEVIEAPFNALYSHSYLFGFAEPSTHTGVKLNYIWNSQVSTYFAVVEGWDVWHDNNGSVSYMVGTALTSKEQVGGSARDTLGINVMTGPEQPHNVTDYRTLFDVTFAHKWTEKLTQAVNFDFGTDDPPTVGQANFYGIAHYLTYVFNDYVSGTWRAEWFRDEKGTRTGVNAAYFENTWGVTITPFPKNHILKNLCFRPELRWDFADQPAFGDNHYNQLTLGMDAIFKF